jgi:hypothetical protein
MKPKGSRKMDARLTPHKQALNNLYPQARADGRDKFERAC